MYKFIFILLVFGLYSCKATEKFADVSDQEPGKWYFAVLEPNSTNAVDAENGFVLEVVPPKFGKRKLILTEEFLSEHATRDGKYRFEVVEGHFQFVIREDGYEELVSDKNTIGFIYRLADVRPQYVYLSKQDIASLKSIEQRYVVEESKIIKTSHKNPPRHLAKNQYFFKGNWLDLKVAEAWASGCYNYTLVFEIKEKLIALGYKLESDNELTEATKEALLDFQRLNNLKVGQIDFETLKALNIEY